MQQQRGRHLTCLSDCFSCSSVSILPLLPTFHEQMDSALSSLSRNYWHWQEIEAGALAGASGALFIEYRVGCLCRGQICGLNHHQRHTSDRSRFAVVLFVTFSSCVWFMPRCLRYASAFVHIYLFYRLSFAEALLLFIRKLLISALLFFSFSLQKQKDKVQTSSLWRLLGQNIERPPTTHKTITLVCSFISKLKLY